MAQSLRQLTARKIIATSQPCYLLQPVYKNSDSWQSLIIILRLFPVEANSNNIIDFVIFKNDEIKFLNIILRTRQHRADAPLP